MLRALKHSFNSPRILPFKVLTESGTTATVLLSPDEFISAVCGAAGRSILTLQEGFSRPGICLGTPFSSNIGAQGAVLIEAAPTINTAQFLSHDGSAGDNGTLNGLIIGYDSLDSDFLDYGSCKAPFAVRNCWNSPRVELFKVTGHATTPVLNIGSAKATISRNGTGDYTITFKRAFSSDAVVGLALPISATAAHIHVVSASATAVRFLVGASGTASDSIPFYVFVQGSDNPQYGGNHRRVTRVSDRRPRLIAGHITYTAGVPAITKGTGDFTITDTGTGVLTIAFTNAFDREPIVLANKDTAGLITVGAAATASGCVLNAFSAVPAAADPNDIHFAVIGYDDADEYSL